VEVISDPLNDMENDPYDDGVDMQRHLSGHQVTFSFGQLLNGFCY
jgi:FKBP12-rapamycin complex-associated protein